MNFEQKFTTIDISKKYLVNFERNLIYIFQTDLFVQFFFSLLKYDTSFKEKILQLLMSKRGFSQNFVESSL